MGWSLGYDSNHKRDIGYGVPSICDHPACNAEIHRGLAYVCGGDVYGGDTGCGLFFCGKHLWHGRDEKFGPICERCGAEPEPAEPFEPKPDVAEWIEWKLTDESWAPWRAENPDWVRQHTQVLSPEAVGEGSLGTSQTGDLL